MPTRLYTTFVTPLEGTDPEDNRGKTWVDVVEDYDTVTNKLYPLQQASSALEARDHFWYTKLEDGLRFSMRGTEVCGFEELPDDHGRN